MMHLVNGYNEPEGGVGLGLESDQSFMSLDVHITDTEFVEYQRLIYRLTGINMNDSKRMLVQGRLSKRLKRHNLRSYKDYFDLIMSDDDELRVAIDMLTTNETYFFREPGHFEYLQQQVLANRSHGRPFRVWSAASSSGEEPYTLAMVLAKNLAAEPWEILGSDLSTRMLAAARAGRYPMERTANIPPEYLKAYCLKGVRRHEGYFCINHELRQRVTYARINLIESLPDIGEFDVIFLRNVMIYFDNETKKAVIENLLTRLRPGGSFFVGHSESLLQGLTTGLSRAIPSVYIKNISR